MSPPSLVTGWAEPMLVDGAMAATLAATVMKTPADPARAPDGETYTTTGMGEASILVMMRRMAVSRPPGVFISMMRAAAPSLTEASMTRVMYCAIIVSTVPSREATLTWRPSSARTVGMTTASSAASTSRTRAKRQKCLILPPLPLLRNGGVSCFTLQPHYSRMAGGLSNQAMAAFVLTITRFVATVVIELMFYTEQ